ncbi:MAG: YhgE/Pip family protein [Sarcina sp.]
MKIFRFLGRDLKKIFKNKAALIIIIGICFIPSLYAWITLKANWNPYVNTANIPIGVVNEDFGTVVKGNIVNVGDQIVDQLQNNHDIGWKFTTIQQGDEGLKNGEYYALIIIPPDFSKDLATLVTSSPIKPTITYKVNDKTNIIATKITEVAKNQLVTQINDNFVKVVNQETIELANDLGQKLQENVPVLNQLKTVMDQADTRIGQIKNNVSQSSESASQLSSYLGMMKNDLPQITGQINSLQTVIEASKNLISSTQSSVSSVASGISSNTPALTNLNDEMGKLVSGLKQMNDSASDNTGQIKIIDNVLGISNKFLNIVNNNIKLLESINSVFNSQIIEANIKQLTQVKNLVLNEQEQLNNMKSLLEQAKPNADQINEQLSKLQGVSNNVVSSTNDLVNNLYSQTIPTINQIAGNLNQGLDNANSLLDSTKAIVPQLQSVANFGINTSNNAVEKASELQGKINQFKDTLNTLQEKANSINQKDLESMINMMSTNPDKIASFLSSPINVQQEEVYGNLPFGAGIMPFYTVLAIWVGSLLLTSLFAVEAKDFEDGTKSNILQKHFGKMLLFLILSFIQATIVTLGDKYVLGFSPQNMWLMMIIAWVSSITFTIIIFTLVSLFGSVGKALCVVIMVFQVAGSGAIYPIQTNPEFFRRIEFLWPFKYALDGFREAIAGPIWQYVYNDLIALGIFVLIFLILGLFKPLFHRTTEFMENKFKQTGL